MMFMTLPQPSDGFEWAQASWGHVLRCRPLQEIADHFFTVASLELRQSDAEWKAVAALAGVPRERLLLLRQVHGHQIAAATLDTTTDWRPPEADGVVGNDASVALVVRVADCAPVLIADRRRGVVAAVHAGWRSTLQRIGGAAVTAMHEHFGSQPRDLIAAIGPSLGACCGEMGEEVVQAFREAGHTDRDLDRWFTRAPGRRPHFDLWRANADQLEQAGLPPGAIHVSGLCTRSYPTVFHSYRAAGTNAGRMVGLIRLKR
jgi:YfiH family protein